MKVNHPDPQSSDTTIESVSMGKLCKGFARLSKALLRFQQEGELHLSYGKGEIMILIMLGIPCIKGSQKRSVQILANLTTVATLFAGVSGKRQNSFL